MREQPAVVSIYAEDVCNTKHNTNFVVADHLIPWLYLELSRELADKLITSSSYGTFLVRPSSDPQAVFTVSVRITDAVLNLRVYRTFAGFYLEVPHDTSRQQCFSDIVDLVRYYSLRPHVTCSMNAKGKAETVSFQLIEPLRVKTTTSVCAAAVFRTVDMADSWKPSEINHASKIGERIRQLEVGNGLKICERLKDFFANICR